MQYKVTSDPYGLIKVLEVVPEKLERLTQTQLKIAVRDIKEYAGSHHAYITRSGKLEREGIETEVNGNEGSVMLSSAVPYAAYVHEGTRAHRIIPRNKRVLRFVSRGSFVFSKRVNHPGTNADQFLYNAAEAKKSDIISRFDEAVERAIGG